MASRIGIIGLGTIGKTHWKVIRESPQTTLIAVADPTPSALDFARAESIPAYADYREMLENETLADFIRAFPWDTPIAIEAPSARRAELPPAERASLAAAGTRQLLRELIAR